jgi:acetyl-CoA acetyltransferase
VGANETFPAQAFVINKGWDWDPAMNGGVTPGDPIGASGARVLTTLLHEMARYNANNTVVPVVAIWSGDCLRRWPVLPSWANAGVDPVVKTGPSPATCKAGWVTKALDLVGANETFPAQAFVINKGWDWDPAMNGGVTPGDPDRRFRGKGHPCNTEPRN